MFLRSPQGGDIALSTEFSGAPLLTAPPTHPTNHNRESENVSEIILFEGTETLNI